MHANYRRWTLVAGTALLGVTGLILGTVFAQQTRLQPTLEQRLIFGLEARRPSELAFVQAVVDSVRRGDLPLSLVNRTFFWARERTPPRSRRRPHRPIVYFEPALTRMAARLRIEIRAERPSNGPAN